MPESIRSDTGAHTMAVAAPLALVRERVAVVVGAWLTEEQVADLTRRVDAWIADWGGGGTVVVSLRQPQPDRTRLVLEWSAPADFAERFAAAQAQGAGDPTLWDVVAGWCVAVAATLDAFTASGCSRARA